MCLFIEIFAECEHCGNGCNGNNCEIFYCCLLCCVSYDKNVKGHRHREQRCMQSCLLLIFIGIICIFSTISTGLFAGSLDISKDTFDNWDKDPLDYITVDCYYNLYIYNLKIDLTFEQQASGQKCLDGFVNFFNYSLPKTGVGCDCTHQTSIFGDKDLHDGQCTRDQANSYCEAVPPTNKIDYNYWNAQATSAAILICAKTEKSLSFSNQLKLKTMLSIDSCKKAGLKVCEVENPDLFYCVQNTSNCPIRGIQVTQQQLSAGLIQKEGWILATSMIPVSQTKLPDVVTSSVLSTDSSSSQASVSSSGVQVPSTEAATSSSAAASSSITTQSGFYLYYSRTTNVFPISEIKASEGDGVCIDPSERNKDKARDKDYVLNNPTATLCETDNRWKQLASVTEKQLVDINQLQKDITQTRPKYQISDKVQISLFARDYIVWHPSCRDIQYDLLVSIDSQLGKLFTSQLALTIILWIAFLVMIFILCNEVFRCCYDCCSKKTCKHFVLAITWLLLGCMSAVIIYAFSLAIRIKQKFQQLKKYDCTDVESQEIFDKITNSVDEVVVPLNTTILIIFIIIVIGDCCAVWYHYNGKYQKYKVKYPVVYQQNVSAIYGSPNTDNMQQQYQTPQTQTGIIPPTPLAPYTAQPQPQLQPQPYIQPQYQQYPPSNNQHDNIQPQMSPYPDQRQQNLEWEYQNNQAYRPPTAYPQQQAYQQPAYQQPAYQYYHQEMQSPVQQAHFIE